MFDFLLIDRKLNEIGRLRYMQDGFLNRTGKCMHTESTSSNWASFFLIRSNAAPAASRSPGVVAPT